MKNKKAKEMMKEAFIDFKKTETDGWLSEQEKYQKEFDMLSEKAESFEEKIRLIESGIHDRGQGIWLPGQPGYEQNGWNMSVYGMKSFRTLYEQQQKIYNQAKKAMDQVERYEQMMEEEYIESGQMEQDELSVIQAMREVDVFYAS